MTISGINLGVSAFSPHPDDAFEAIKCLANKQNQATDAVKGGLPPTLAALYDDPAVQKAYPFHALIKHSLQAPALRPQTPAYSAVVVVVRVVVLIGGLLSCSPGPQANAGNARVPRAPRRST